MIGNLFFHIVEDIIRNISGPVGTRLRRIYYKRRLGKAGNKLIIDTGVSFQNPREIFLGDQVWIDKNCVFIAGRIKPDSGSIVRKGFSDTDNKEGCIQLGSFSHIGIGTIIQGHGGVSTGDCFTSSAGCRIYSFSNDYRNCRDGTIESQTGKPAYIMGSVTIGRNVWIGLGVSVISTEIGDNCFVLPHAVVYQPLGKNLVAGGNPAIEIRKRFYP
jgi:galactoside O-acetyltransferase